MTEVQTSPQACTSSEELAYLLIEEARLCCKTLLDEEWAAHSDPDELSLGGPDELSLGGLYGDLGIAGYHASARLDPERRERLLEQARSRSERTLAISVDSAQHLSEITAAASRSVERALAITGLLDHMHLAHIHVMSACERLDAMFALQT